MAVRSARTEWAGSLTEGSGRVELTSSKAGAFDVSFPRRTADEAGGVTSPEELIAAALTSCYCMQLAGMSAAAGATVHSLVATADVSLGPDPAGGLRLTGIKLTVRGQLEGLDSPGFIAVADEASKTCPVSKALAGVTITLDADLA